MPLQPTNAGIDYQQRVGAMFLFIQFADLSIRTFTSLELNGEIVKVRMEGDECIDDLSITLDNEIKILFQIKRKINFSTKVNSEFNSVIKQFVKQFKFNSSEEYYVLTTSSDSSKVITQRLRRLLNAVRTSDGKDFKSTFNKSDKDLIEQFEKIIENTHFNEFKEKMTYEQLYKIIKRIHIEVLDVEEGLMLEKNILILLSQKVSVDPIMFWRALIASSLTFASNRQTVTKKHLTDVYGNYLGKPFSQENINEIIFKSDFAVDRDVLLCKSNDLKELIEEDINKNIVFIIELFRFEESGEKRITYNYPDKALLNNNKSELELIYRASTISGVEKFLACEENRKILEGYELRILAANDDAKSENDRSNKLHHEWMRQSAIENCKNNKCMNCMNPLFLENTLLIEIDCSESEPKVGGIHKECLVPTDRVLGYMQIPSFKEIDFILNFDYPKWIDIAKKSSSVFNAKKINQPANMLWDQHYNNNLKADFVIKINLENGDFAIMTKRGKVHRLGKSEGKKFAKKFDLFLKKSLRESNPQCYTSDFTMFGDYNFILSIESENDPIACISAEIVRYNYVYSECFDLAENYYAPLVYFLNDDRIVSINNRIIMLSNVTRYSEFLDNWSKLELDFREFKAVIIENDDEFDKFAYQARDDNMSILVDPKFGRYKEVTSGYFVESMQDLIKRKNYI